MGGRGTREQGLLRLEKGSLLAPEKDLTDFLRGPLADELLFRYMGNYGTLGARIKEETAECL